MVPPETAVVGWPLRAVAQLPQPLLEAGQSSLAAFPRSAAFAARRKHSNSPSSGFIEPNLWLSAQLKIEIKMPSREVRRRLRLGYLQHSR